MTLDPEFNAVKVEKADVKLEYNPVEKTVNIGTQNINNYHITIQLPPNTKGTASEIEQRASEVALAVKSLFLVHPEQLKGLGSTVHLALLNSTGVASHTNITFIATGVGPIKI